MFLLSFLIGLIPVAHANTPTLTTWGATNAGVSAMWGIISGSIYTNIPADDVVTAVTSGIVNFIFTFIAGAAVLLIMYAGIRMIASRGKEDEFSQGKTIITYALIGLVLSLLARAVVAFLVTAFLPTFLG